MHYLSEHTNVEQKVQCDICGAWLKHHDSYMRHKRRHKLKETGTQTCELCGRETKNKVSLRAHLEREHRGVRFPCTVCSATFKRACRLKVIHLFS